MSNQSTQLGSSPFPSVIIDEIDERPNGLSLFTPSGVLNSRHRPNFLDASHSTLVEDTLTTTTTDEVNSPSRLSTTFVSDGPGPRFSGLNERNQSLSQPQSSALIDPLLVVDLSAYPEGRPLAASSSNVSVPSASNDVPCSPSSALRLSHHRYTCQWWSGPAPDEWINTARLLDVSDPLPGVEVMFFPSAEDRIFCPDWDYNKSILIIVNHEHKPHYLKPPVDLTDRLPSHITTSMKGVLPDIDHCPSTWHEYIRWWYSSWIAREYMKQHPQSTVEASATDSASSAVPRVLPIFSDTSGTRRSRSTQGGGVLVSSVRPAGAQGMSVQRSGASNQFVGAAQPTTFKWKIFDPTTLKYS
ncbi:hypothetical protein FB446DRAFT_849746 [Lentinula raphanica]|nr:hypothetical protein FB446DRAFT_849746 [Lentinula raphanica]